jgi:asparagine synthase (glutamine-hydrolysing)
MAHSLEARVPFLDRRFVELCRRLPARMRLRGLTSKWILRHAMRDRLPPAITKGKKRGFSAPMPAWFAGALRDYTADMLSPSRVRRQGLFEPAAVHRYIAEHTTRRVDHSRPLLTLLVFSVWFEEIMNVTREAVAVAAGADA